MSVRSAECSRAGLIIRGNRCVELRRRGCIARTASNPHRCERRNGCTNRLVQQERFRRGRCTLEERMKVSAHDEPLRITLGDLSSLLSLRGCTTIAEKNVSRLQGRKALAGLSHEKTCAAGVPGVFWQQQSALPSGITTMTLLSNTSAPQGAMRHRGGGVWIARRPFGGGPIAGSRTRIAPRQRGPTRKSGVSRKSLPRHRFSLCALIDVRTLEPSGLEALMKLPGRVRKSRRESGGFARLCRPAFRSAKLFRGLFFCPGVSQKGL